MEESVTKGEVFACPDPSCPVEVEVSQGGHCRDLSCCGQVMIRKTSEEEMLDRYERETRGECDHEEA